MQLVATWKLNFFLGSTAAAFRSWFSYLERKYFRRKTFFKLPTPKEPQLSSPCPQGPRQLPTAFSNCTSDVCSSRGGLLTHLRQGYNEREVPVFYAVWRPLSFLVSFLSAICRPSHLSSEGPQQFYVPFDRFQMAVGADGTVSIKICRPSTSVTSVAHKHRPIPATVGAVSQLSPGTSVTHGPSPFSVPQLHRDGSRPRRCGVLYTSCFLSPLSPRSLSSDHALYRVNQFASGLQLTEMVLIQCAHLMRTQLID